MRKKTLSIVLDAFIVMLVITIILLIIMIVKRGKVTVDEENPFLALRNGQNTEEDYEDDGDVTIVSASANSASQNSAEEKKEEVDNNIYAEVTGDTVNIRRGAGTDYERLGSASKGETFILEAVLSNGWSRVQYKTGQGFISNDFLRFVKKRPDGNIEVDDAELPTE